MDKTFVRDVPDDPDDVAIVQAIVAMAHRLRLEVVAEGAETAERRALLEDCGCDEIPRGTSSARRSRRNISPRWGDWSPNAREARRLRGSVAHRRRLYQINGGTAWRRA
ncbi:MAG: EAL domain-containing protein [Actinomycetota bacterium]